MKKWLNKDDPFISSIDDVDDDKSKLNIKSTDHKLPLQSLNNDIISEEDGSIQRTFLDLLNSELDFQQNTVSSTRVSLLLKLEQFI
jgi:hypothetical protein